MKKINYYSTILSLAVICFFTSCSSTKYGAHFAPSKKTAPSYTKAQKADEPLLVLEEGTTEVLENVALRSGADEVNADALPKTETMKELITEVKTIDETEFTEHQQQILAETKERLKNMTRKEKRQLRREIRKIKLEEYTKDLPAYENMDAMQDRGGTVNILALVFAIILPPLGVFIHQGEINNRFWISLILTLLGYVPGQVYAVLLVLGVI